MSGPLNGNPRKYRYTRVAFCARGGCGKLFCVPTDRPDQKFCSRACWNEHRARSHISICVHRACGREFDNKGDFDKKFCCKECLDAAMAAAKVVPFTPCLNFNCKADTGHPRRRYCSDGCRAAARSVRKALYVPQPSRPKEKKKRVPTTTDLALYARVMAVGTKSAGAEMKPPMSKSAVNGRMWRAGLSTEGAPRPAPLTRAEMKPSSLIRVQGGVTFSNLNRYRGWSKRLITKLLGNPDRVDFNRYTKSPCWVWAIKRVLEAEKHPDFIAYQSVRKRYSSARTAGHIVQRLKEKFAQEFRREL